MPANPNPIRAMFQAQKEEALNGRPAPAPTLAEAVEEQAGADAVRVTEIEQFQFNQSLSPQEARVVELICTHQNRADLDNAISAIQRLKRLAYCALALFVCFTPSCAAGSASLTYDAATHSFGVSATYPAGKIIRPTK